MITTPIRLMIVDDHQLFTDGLISIFKEEESVEVVGTASNGKALLTWLQTHEADVVLLDISMPELDGVATSEQLLKLYPDLKILIVSMHNSPNYLEKLNTLGVHGYTLKEAGKQEMLKAIHKVVANEIYYHPQVMQNLLKSKRRGNELVRFTDREIEVIRLVAQFKNNREISDQLCISYHTVLTHRRNIRTKTKTSGNAELIEYARTHKLI